MPRLSLPRAFTPLAFLRRRAPSHYGLAHAISHALTQRNPGLLRHLVQRHGAATVASALLALSARQREDALSLLTPAQREALQLESSAAQHHPARTVFLALRA